MRRKKIVCAIIIVALFSTSLIQAQSINQSGPFFTLTILVTSGKAFDYGVYIVKYLKDINIDARIKVWNYDCNIPNSYPKINKDWDLAVCSYKGGGKSPDMRDLFTENGSQNIFNLNSKIPYQNESEYMQNKAASTFDLDERQQLYYDWQQLVMSNIVPVLPLFSPRLYTSIWSNTESYEMRWGLSDSSPYMSFNGLHEGQENLNEFNVAYNEIEKHGPSSIDNQFNFLFWELISEPIIQWSPDNAPLKTGLIFDWEEVGNSHHKFYMRDNIVWNPSFNISDRDSTSEPLVIETSPDDWEVIDPGILISGLKSGQVSNGMNQLVTAKDAVFTLLATAHPLISEKAENYKWLKDCYVDPSDPFAFHVFVDENPETILIEPMVDFFSYLDLGILPEFFLNSTDDTVTLTSGGIECVGLNETIRDTMQWNSYEISPFGCGKFMLDYFSIIPQTVVSWSPFWFGVGAIDGTTGMTPFVEKVNIYDYPDEEERIEIFKTGKLDLISVTSYPHERRIMQQDYRFEFQTEIQNILNLIAFNLESESIGGSSNYERIIGTDGENSTEACAVRKAICYAIDREEINQVFHDGEYTLCHNPMYLYTAYYYYDDVIKYYHDLDAAWEWMEAAGYKVDLTNIYPSVIIAVFCLISISKIVYKKKIRKEKKKS